MASSSSSAMAALAVVMIFAVWEGAWAQSNCMTAIVSLSPCMNYVTGNSSAQPSSSCCSQLANVVQSTPQCLCSLLNGGGSSFGININQTLAMSLPAACKVQTPPVSRCNAANGPSSPAAVPPAATSPVGSEAPSDSETPTTPSGSGSTIPTSGSKTVPSTNGSSSADNNVGVSFHILSFFLFAASWALSSATI
ncbi:non-specific lipid-transfer protein-like protein At2g13820 [Ipomoea triloba]|uniref:non-specific lipid-transfer protein-like protein At2g13820 n=1 Tax=Ipomoea triloba TaxID=35885 RepID=UPI00125E66C6|nr:non-specific lipid-transfer protein-like protein At2g13820 [Ipomoea triloba]